ncbi:MAG: AAA family ATPase [Cellvibrionaceae bacterium]|nr:AAA family ATPase [Cellvibrionaceae bacterium]
MNYNDLSILLHSNISLIVVETFDETRALTLLQKYFRDEGIGSWRWSATDGLQPLGFGLQAEDQNNQAKPEDVLNHIKKSQKASAFVLCDLHPYLDEPKMVRLLKDIALNQMAARHRVVLISHRLKLPPEIARYAAVLQMSLPTDEEILALVREEAKLWSDRNSGARIKTDNATLQKLVNNLRGLPHQDVRRLARGAIVDDGAISDGDLPELSKAKFALMDMDGVLHFEYSTAHLKDIAGLNRLKIWLAERQQAMVGDGQSKIDPPKGVLLFGVQGGGKSLAAKAIAGIWGLPLLRLDMAAVYNKYVGETERNLRDALKLADVMSPCVLWIDEIEKGLAQNDGENATSKRLLGTLLTWMAERKSRVFLVATSNDISVLPPELMRKGRFDEIFFVDLPDTEIRRAMFEIHMGKRGLVSSNFDLSELAVMSEGFTGAEVEQAVVSALYSASARAEQPAMEHMRAAIANTRPLSVIMAERMNQLRAWAADRAVAAN